MIEDMKQWLEALEIYWGKAEHRRTREDERQAESAITSLRKAIQEEALRNVQRIGQEIEQEPVALQMDVIVVNLVREGINKHRARELAEHFIRHTHPPKRTEQEPVECDGDFPEGFDKSLDIPAQALRQANAALCEVTNNRMWDVPALAERMLMFCRNTHPPQRKWVGLTDDEAKEIQLRMVYGNHPFLNVINAIEAKLKEKNT